MSILFKGNIEKEGYYKLLKTTDGYVLDHQELDGPCYAGHKVIYCEDCERRKEDVSYDDLYLCGYLRTWVKNDDYCCWPKPRKED